MSVGPSHFRISILSAYLVALREKLKKADPNHFSILGLDSGYDFLKLVRGRGEGGGQKKKVEKNENLFS